MASTAPGQHVNIAPMTTDTAHRTDQRLEHLEVKATYAEDLLDRLNEVVVRQQRQIDNLQQQVDQLRQQLAAAPEQPAFRSLRDELPPHY